MSKEENKPTSRYIDIIQALEGIGYKVVNIVNSDCVRNKSECSRDYKYITIVIRKRWGND